jgi:hypothetical protein
MSNILIIDDLIPKQLQDKIENVFLNPEEANWFFHPTSCGEYNNPYAVYMNHKNVVEAPQFCHYMYDEKKGINSDYFNHVASLLTILKQEYTDVNFDIVRIKANLQLQNKLSCNEKHAAPHRDFDFGHHVFLYYMNDSDGDTFLFNELGNGEIEVVERVSPKKGRIVCFDGEWLHASSVPINSEYRAVLNMDMRITH